MKTRQNNKCSNMICQSTSTLNNHKKYYRHQINQHTTTIEKLNHQLNSPNSNSQNQQPWFTPTLREKIEKAQRNQLTNQEYATVLHEIAEISTNFYPVKHGQCIAIKILTGEIVETAEKELDLLKKIQCKNFGSPIFVWKVGFNSFAGWKAWR